MKDVLLITENPEKISALSTSKYDTAFISEELSSTIEMLDEKIIDGLKPESDESCFIGNEYFVG